MRAREQSSDSLSLNAESPAKKERKEQTETTEAPKDENDQSKEAVVEKESDPIEK